MLVAGSQEALGPRTACHNLKSMRRGLWLVTCALQAVSATPALTAIHTLCRCV